MFSTEQDRALALRALNAAIVVRESREDVDVEEDLEILNQLWFTVAEMPLNTSGGGLAFSAKK